MRRSLKRSVLGIIVASALGLALVLGSAGTASADYRNFCYGANIGPSGGGCESGTWWINGVFANSATTPVCAGVRGGTYGCIAHPNEGVYASPMYGGCAYSRGFILNWSGETAQVYGTLLTC